MYNSLKAFSLQIQLKTVQFYSPEFAKLATERKTTASMKVMIKISKQALNNFLNPTLSFQPES